MLPVQSLDEEIGGPYHVIRDINSLNKIILPCLWIELYRIPLLALPSFKRLSSFQPIRYFAFLIDTLGHVNSCVTDHWS